MIQICNIRYWRWRVFLLLLFVVNGCIREKYVKEPESEEREIDVRLNIAFQLQNGAETRADDETTPGTPIPESELKSLSIFIVDLNDTDDPLPATFRSFRFTSDMPEYEVDGSPRGVYTAYLKTMPGKKRLYLAANLTSLQEREFVAQYKITGEKAILSSTGVDDFITSVDGFAMFCTESKIFEVQNSVLEYPDDGSTSYDFTLERLYAKALLTAESYDSQYVKIKNEPTVGENGWIDLATVEYRLRTLNTKLYLFPVKESGKRIDPNYNMGDGSGDFIDSDNWYPALEYNASKMPKADSNPGDGSVYSEGIYSPENLVYESTPQTDAFRRDYTTHMEIKARYIPRHFYVAEGGALVRKSYDSEADALSIITLQGGNTYTTDADGSKHYYTDQAKTLAVTGGIAESSFTKYSGNIHTYTTYLDGTNNASGDIVFSNDYSSVMRNRYYILCLSAFDIENGPIIEVTTTLLPWQKTEIGSWFSEVSGILTSKWSRDEYKASNNPDGIPISYNLMNQTLSGDDLYNATFYFDLTGMPGVSWAASLSDPIHFGLYVNTEGGVVANGTLPTKTEDNSVTENTNGTVTKRYKISVYAKSPYSGVTTKTHLTITADGVGLLVNPEAEVPYGADAMPPLGEPTRVLIIQQ